MDFFKSQIIQSVFNYILAASIFFLWTWYYLRRKIFPITGRAPDLMFAAGIYLGLFSIIGVFDYDFVPCEVTAWISNLSINTCTILYTQRAWILLFRFEITANLRILDEMKHSGATTEEFTKKRGLVFT